MLYLVQTCRLLSCQNGLHHPKQADPNGQCALSEWAKEPGLKMDSKIYCPSQAQYFFYIMK
jgi:hypothetical protein